MNVEPASVALLAATSLHAGFQAVVTLVVYPAFRDVPPEHWRQSHDHHTRRITGIVVAVYGLLVVTSGWVVAAGPRNVGTLAAVALAAVAVLTTALVAAPAHGRLGSGRDERVIDRLVRADRVRFVAAVLAVAAAVVGLLG